MNMCSKKKIILIFPKRIYLKETTFLNSEQMRLFANSDISAEQAAAELNQNLHTQRVSFLLRSLRDSRNDSWRFCAVDEIFRNSKA